MGKVISITVNDLPLKEKIENDESLEIEESRVEIERSHRIYKRPIKRIPERKEKDGEVRQLTREEIRKEKGYMAVKNGSFRYEVLNMLYQYPGVTFTPSYMKEALGLKPDDKRSKLVSPALSSMYKFLGDEIIERVDCGREKGYTIEQQTCQDFIIDELYDILKEYENTYKRSLTAQKNGKKEEHIPQGGKLSSEKTSKERNENVHEENMEQNKQDTNPPKDINININVNIKFV